MAPISKRRSLAAALNRRYETRRVTLPQSGERTLPALALAALLALLLMSVLLSLAWVQKSDVDYLRGSSGVRMLDGLAWDLSLPDQPPRRLTLEELGRTSVKQLAGQPFLITAQIDAETMRRFAREAGDATVVLSLPPFEFQRVRLAPSWLEPRVLARGEPLLVSFDPREALGTQVFAVTLTVWPMNTQERVLHSAVNVVPAFLAVDARYQKYQDQSAARRLGAGKQLADIGRIVLAVFSVLLYVFIDSSAECFGLAIFMSLKALAVVVGQGWLPDGWFAASTETLTRHFLLSFADFMQLYFFTQLARLWAPRPFAWLAAGIGFGVLYTLGATVTPAPGGVDWPFQVWKWRNLLIGLGCLASSLPIALVCWRGRVYHRTTALIVASSGVLSQVITPLIVGIPGVTDSLLYKTWYNLFETHTPYMFALSTFINVSTLERRVKLLSSAVIHKEAIERELTLGKAVQEAFFRIPEMPPGIGIAYAHEAAAFVSGDILFSYWDRSEETVTMILCDVTGHGVQAALKASICSAMCAAIWEHGQLRPDDEPSSRLAILDHRVTSYLTRTSGNPEILAMVGCEVDLKTGVVQLYRANGLFPVVMRRSGGQWRIRAHALASGRTDHLAPGAVDFIAIFSDGIIDSARTLRSLVLHLGKALPADGPVDVDTVKQVVLSFGGFVDTGDDKTLAVLDLTRVRESASAEIGKPA